MMDYNTTRFNNEDALLLHSTVNLWFLFVKILNMIPFCVKRHGNDYPALPAPSAISDGQCTAPALTLPEPKRIRRGLRMGTQSPHVRLRQTSLVVHQQSAPAPPVQLLVLPPPPVIIPPLPTATSSSTTVESRQPFGLR